MPAPDSFPLAAALFAYGSVPGVELIPYFLALLTWIGLALGALFLSPFTALFRRLRRALGAAPLEAKVEPAATPAATPTAPPVLASKPTTPEPLLDGARDSK